MSRYHPNTLKLIALENEAIRLGWTKRYPHRCFSYEVAEEAGELGEDYPSDEAIEIARRKLEEFKREISNET